MALQLSFYKEGLARLTPDGWASRTDDEVMLIEDGTGWVFDADHVSLDSVVASELAATNYLRQPVVPGAASWSEPVWSLPMGAVTWPNLGAAEPIEAVIGFEEGASDTLSVPLWVVHDSVPGTTIATCDGTTLTFTVTLAVS